MCLISPLPLMAVLTRVWFWFDAADNIINNHAAIYRTSAIPGLPAPFLLSLKMFDWLIICTGLQFASRWFNQCLTRDEYWFMQGWLLNSRWIIWQITIIMKSNGHTSFSLLHNTYSPCVIVAKTYCIVLIHFNLINIRNMWYFYCVHV